MFKTYFFLEQSQEARKDRESNLFINRTREKGQAVNEILDKHKPEITERKNAHFYIMTSN